MSGYTKEQREIIYHNHVKQMQGMVLFCQDEEGVLRRWYPPKPIQVVEEDR